MTTTIIIVQYVGDFIYICTKNHRGTMDRWKLSVHSKIQINILMFLVWLEFHTFVLFAHIFWINLFSKFIWFCIMYVLFFSITGLINCCFYSYMPVFLLVFLYLMFFFMYIFMVLTNIIDIWWNGYNQIIPMNNMNTFEFNCILATK